MDQLFHGIYKGRKVFVTGHTGFKGAWLALWLKEMGAEVTGFSLDPPTEPSLFKEIGLENKITHIVGDIRDQQAVEAALEKAQPEIIFHLAAQPLVRLSYSEPVETYATNVMGTIHVLEAAKKIKPLKAIVNVTSDKCYENREWLWGYRENEAMGGYDPYSSSKGCAELVTSAYRNSFFNPAQFGKSHNVALGSGRAGNVIGGGDWALDRLVPDCFRALSEEQSILIRSPQATRPWQHVMEPLSGYLWLGAKLFKGEIKFADGWNFGPTNEDVLEVKKIVDLVLKNWGSGKMIVEQDKKLHEATLLKLDISKAAQLLEWIPVMHAAEAIKITTEWYKTFYCDKTADLAALTTQQIKAYCQAAKEKNVAWAIK